MNNNEILKNLHKFIDSKTDDDKVFSVLKRIQEKDIFIGEKPKYFFATISCNSTGVGVSSFKGTETQRTVARDYVTDEHLYIDGHIGAGAKGLSLFYLKPGETINYYSKDDITKVAKRYGFQLHSQYFRDLNFRIDDHRLNRYNVNITRKQFTYPITPIFATISDNGDHMLLGYVYEMEGKEYIIIEPEKVKETKKGAFAPWMLLGFLFPPIFLIALFVYLVKSKKEQMIG